MCTDALVGCVAALALLVLTPAASAKEGSVRQVASGKISKGAARTAVEAVERVEREMAREGANRSRVLGCWRNGPGVVDCTGEVRGDDGYLTWRCMLQIRIRKRQTAGHKSKLTGAVCVVEAVAESNP